MFNIYLLDCHYFIFLLFYFDVYLVVYFGLHLFLFNLLARKLCAINYVHFPILALFCMPFDLKYSLHLQNYGSYIYAFWK